MPRDIKIVITVRDHLAAYEVSQLGASERIVPFETSPLELARWIAQTVVAMVRDANTSYPLPKPEPEVEIKALAKKPIASLTPEDYSDLVNSDIPF